MKYKVLKNRILVEPIKGAEKTASGLFIPETAQEKPNRGTVVDINAIEGINIGDIVIYKQHTGTEIKIDNVLYYIFREDDILLIEQ